ncbi:MAG: helix-turn-helix domain-containing protein [Pseudohongiellaceae bacterium]
MKKLPRNTARRSPCPVATTLDVVGDKWTLLIVRDLGLFGRHRNKDMQNAREGIPSNILADRLKTLQELGLVRRRRYQDRPPRYEYHLTPAGEDLLPIVRAMARWGAEHVAGIRIPTPTHHRQEVG